MRRVDKLLVLPEHLAKQRAILEELRIEVKVEIDFLFLSLRVPLQAAMGIAELITMAMEKEGLPKDECIKKIWMVDSKGLIVKVSNCHSSPYMRSRSSRYFCFLFIHKQFKNKEVGIGVEKSKLRKEILE